MLQRTIFFLADLNVGKKMMLAFGLVSLLSIAAIAMALKTAELLLDGNRQSQAIGELNLLLQEARGAEKDFSLTGKQENADLLELKLSKLDIRVNEILEDRSTVNHEQLKKIRLNARAYREQFDHFHATKTQSDLALAEMQKQADNARIQLEFVELDMFSALRESVNGQGELDPNTLTFAENSSTLLRLLLQMRGYEFGYVQRDDKQELSAWKEIMSDAEADVSRLRGRIGEEHQDILQAAQEALTNYHSAFKRYSESRAANQHSAMQMQELADRVLQGANEALNSHRDWLENYADTILHLLVVSAGVILTLALLAGWGIRQLILPPLHQTLDLAKRIAAGDLSQNITTARRDELGQLYRAMGGMTSNLRELIRRILDGVDQLRGAAGALQEASQQSSGGALDQQRQTALAANATRQMATSAEAVANYAENASGAAADANKHAKAGEHVVRKSAEQIGRLANDVKSSTDVIRDLHQSSERIGGVLDVIKMVAEQTNLLALNAAIEAARAGEQGRGFAVVADEVRALARRTQESTHEIEALVAELQGISLRALQQMTESSELSNQAVAYGEQARQSLNRITSAVSSIELLNGQIAAAAGEQSTVAVEISLNVENVRSVANQGADATQRVALASTELTRLGTELQQLVQQFRI
ncbi:MULTISPECIES: methyl-accepting chemotaxis protein [unclassified Pseudomonas]|uniref:methyl-accepting chemotaxis protein n=1 Tax=unclassified Pseudomonas TaxID=196821 RepID=UPI002457AD2B|nr:MULTISPECIES: methyl-accepting chemotaxis protein [unclassified Pseudomonas]MDH4561308.1 HAMP domain-containing protein [Pseudomonas sp. BN411]MDH4657000.1 HAMP domain-containing protein [Pseudomonas sp. BN606]